MFRNVQVSGLPENDSLEAADVDEGENRRMMMTDMMSSMSSPVMETMDMEKMQACMDACMACEQACTMCADSSTGEDMGRCASMCATTADMSMAMMRMMMRPMGMHRESMMAMLEACAMMMRACGEECTSHEGMHDQYRMCGNACMAAAEACDAMRMSMTA